jgi:NNP family nitrate/nitrite transporter-like MFS transporter
VGAFFAALLLKYKSAMAEEAAIAASEGLSADAISAAQSLASATAVSSGYLLIGCLVVITAISALAIRFSRADEEVINENVHQPSLEALMPIKVEK